MTHWLEYLCVVGLACGGMISLFMISNPGLYERLWRRQFRSWAPPGWETDINPTDKIGTRLTGVILFVGVVFFGRLLWGVISGEFEGVAARPSLAGSVKTIGGIVMAIGLATVLGIVGGYAILLPHEAAGKLRRLLVHEKRPVIPLSWRERWIVRLLGIVLMLAGGVALKYLFH